MDWRCACLFDVAKLNAAIIAIRKRYCHGTILNLNIRGRDDGKVDTAEIRR